MLRSLTLLALSPMLSAQNDRLTAHPQDRPHVGTGQIMTLGDDPTFCEAHCQLLLRAQHLPGPGAVLLGIEVHALTPGTVFYESLAITVSAAPPGAPRSVTFAQNMPMPVQIVQLANQSLTWTAAGWQRLAAMQPYVHDGVSDLTIDIEKDATPAVGAPSGRCTAWFRSDLAPMLGTWGPAGFGSATATTAGAMNLVPPDVRLVWGNAPTARLRSTIPGPLHHGFVVGGSLDHLTTATPGSLIALAGDLQWSAPVTLPFAAGQWWVQGPLLAADVVPANGESVLTFAIPNAPAFVTFHIAYQALVIDAGTGQWQFTNASDCILGL